MHVIYLRDRVRDWYIPNTCRPHVDDRFDQDGRPLELVDEDIAGLGSELWQVGRHRLTCVFNTSFSKLQLGDSKRVPEPIERIADPVCCGDNPVDYIVEQSPYAVYSHLDTVLDIQSTYLT